MKYKHSIATVLMTTFAAVLTFCSGITHAAQVTSAPGFIHGNGIVGAAMDGNFMALTSTDMEIFMAEICPQDRLSHSLSVSAGDTNAWTCGSWLGSTTFTLDGGGKPKGFTEAVSAVVKPAEGDSIVDAERACHERKWTTTEKSNYQIECRVGNGTVQRVMSYSILTDGIPVTLFGKVLWDRMVNRISVAVTVTDNGLAH